MKIWNAFLGQNPTNDDLQRIIHYAPDEYRTKAWEQLLKQNPTNDDLRWIIRNAPNDYRAKAKELLEFQEELEKKSKNELVKLMA